MREPEQEGGEGLLERDAHGAVVHHLRALDERRVEARLEWPLVPEHAIEAVLDGLGIEGRAVVEADARAKREGPGEAVLRWRPRLGQGRLELHLGVGANEV